MANRFWATVCKTIRPMLSKRCLSCSVLSMTLVYCGQTAGWIKLPLGVEVGLGPGHLFQMRTQLPQRGTAPIFRPISVVAKWLIGSMPLGREIGLSSGDIALDRDLAPQKRQGHSSPHFWAHVSCGQTAGWIKMSLGPDHIVLDGNPAPPKKERGQSPNSRPIFVAAKRMDESTCYTW